MKISLHSVINYRIASKTEDQMRDNKELSESQAPTLRWSGELSLLTLSGLYLIKEDHHYCDAYNMTNCH